MHHGSSMRTQPSYSLSPCSPGNRQCAHNNQDINVELTHKFCVHIASVPLIIYIMYAGMQAELILGVVARQEKQVVQQSHKPYLQQRVEYGEGRLMDEESKGVMMAWENPLMEAHAKAICSQGGDILNVGFGMGLVDTAIQGHNPTSHTIIEAHPDVYKQMLATGWAKKPNVRILFGRWQDVLPQLSTYDGTVVTLISFQFLKMCIFLRVRCQG